MSCNYPLTAFYTGSKTEKGKPDYVIGKTSDKLFRCSEAEKKGHTILPTARITNIQGISYLVDPVQIPCGHCVGCRMEHAKEWKIRCCLEAMEYDDVWFVTLTYKDSHLRTHFGQVSLFPDDMTKFWKRFRKEFGQCRYFYCGEYGENTFRPHYHAIIFGSKFLDLEQTAPNVYRSKKLDRCWSHGLCSISKAEPNCIAYVCGYVEKKQNDPMWSSYAIKPFVRMSRKPAIGSIALDKLIPGILSSSKVYGNFNGSHFANVPRTFVRKLEETFPDWFKAYHKQQDFNGHVNAAAQANAYGTTDQYYVGFAKDKAAFEKLEKLRISKL